MLIYNCQKEMETLERTKSEVNKNEESKHNKEIQFK